MANEIQAKVCLVIIDGWGHTDDYTAFLRTKIKATNNDIVLDAIEQANTPFYDKICQENGFLTLCASGQAVGLPENTIGNSQVGHITIGTGRCVKQPLLKIGDLFSQGKMNAILEENGLLNTNNHNRNILHMIGLASDGGIHSHMDHLIEMMKIFSHSQVYKKIILHLITDGRDTAPMSCLKYINTIFKKSEELNQKHGSNSVQIGSIAGRWYTMDR
ncbi:2,3-bisphosphoglycerate-independent phosphoglycerate mutase, partial [Pseudoloma neurophilia]